MSGWAIVWLGLACVYIMAGEPHNASVALLCGTIEMANTWREEWEQ